MTGPDEQGGDRWEQDFRPDEEMQDGVGSRCSRSSRSWGSSCSCWPWRSTVGSDGLKAVVPRPLSGVGGLVRSEMLVTGGVS